VKAIVVALDSEYAVVSTALRLTLMSVASRYGNVNEKAVVLPLPVYVFCVVAITL
tara:strand:- start:1009 stop:1173 length:165 start_codon:yes stop_codon:yes gene_type:complete